MSPVMQESSWDLNADELRIRLEEPAKRLLEEVSDLFRNISHVCLPILEYRM